jgi:hypothetical protein
MHLSGELGGIDLSGWQLEDHLHDEHELSRGALDQLSTDDMRMIHEAYGPHQHSGGLA